MVSDGRGLEIGLAIFNAGLGTEPRTPVEVTMHFLNGEIVSFMEKLIFHNYGNWFEFETSLLTEIFN